MEVDVIKYLNYLSLPVSKCYVRKLVVSHPDYPSLLSISDSLQQLGIKSNVAVIKAKYLGKPSFPYLLHNLTKPERLHLIKDQDDLSVFKKGLSGETIIILKADPNQNIKDEQHNAALKKENIFAVAVNVLSVALAGLLLIAAVINFNWVYVGFLLTAVCGAITAYLLFVKALGITYKPVEAFCNAGKRMNCDRILNAADAQLFGFFTFTDAAISYFAFQLMMLGLFVPLNTDPFLGIFAATVLCSILVIIYSIYYQKGKARTWCRLCLVVDAILLIQNGIVTTYFFTGGALFEVISYASVLIALLLFVAIAASVVLLKDRLELLNASANREMAALRVKHDPDVFIKLLFKQEKVDATPFKQEMVIGDAKAPIKILMVANLHCNPCRKAYKVVKQLAAAYPDKICFSICLTPDMNKAIGRHSASTYFIRYWQQHIYGGNNPAFQTQKFINDWYSQMNPEIFAKQYPADGEINERFNQLDEKHYQWVEENNIVRTPTFFVNGYELPRNYSLTDFMALAPGLAVLIKEHRVSQKTSRNKEIA